MLLAKRKHSIITPKARKAISRNSLSVDSRHLSISWQTVRKRKRMFRVLLVLFFALFSLVYSQCGGATVTTCEQCVTTVGCDYCSTGSGNVCLTSTSCTIAGVAVNCTGQFATCIAPPPPTNCLIPSGTLVPQVPGCNTTNYTPPPTDNTGGFVGPCATAFAKVGLTIHFSIH